MQDGSSSKRAHLHAMLRSFSHEAAASPTARHMPALQR
jgi:hypothetical protein